MLVLGGNFKASLLLKASKLDYYLTLSLRVQAYFYYFVSIVLDGRKQSFVIEFYHVEMTPC